MQPPDYKVWEPLLVDTEGFAVFYISTSPAHFNRADIVALAAKLSRDFAQYQKLKIGLLDDENTARNIAAGRIEIRNLPLVEKGMYYLDRTRCREYIRFIVGGKQRRSVVIRFRCSRK